MNDSPNLQKLMAMTQVLIGRADDTAARKEISQTAFINLCKGLGVNVTHQTLGDLIAKPPLNGILEPLEPNSGVVRFKGNLEKDANMNAQQARSVVDRNAKRAMKKK